MTYQPNAAALKRLFETNQCPHCRKSKDSGSPFCGECLEKLPSDIRIELIETKDTITRNLAYADAQIFLEGDFK